MFGGCNTFRVKVLSHQTSSHLNLLKGFSFTKLTPKSSFDSLNFRALYFAGAVNLLRKSCSFKILHIWVWKSHEILQLPKNKMKKVRKFTFYVFETLIYSNGPEVCWYSQLLYHKVSWRFFAIYLLFILAVKFNFLFVIN